MMMKKYLLGALVVSALGIVVGLFGSVMGKAPRDQGQKAEPVSKSAACSIKKADGSPPDRECDLVELCKDLSYYEKKASNARRRGELKDAVNAEEHFVRTLAYLHEYKAEDVVGVCGAGGATTRSASSPEVRDKAACNSSPFLAITLDQPYLMHELRRSLDKACPGAEQDAAGNFLVSWDGKDYAIVTVRVGTQGARVVEAVRQQSPSEDGR